MCKVGNFLNNEYCSDEEETWVTLMSRLTLGRQWNEALNHCFVGGGHEKEESFWVLYHSLIQCLHIGKANLLGKHKSSVECFVQVFDHEFKAKL